MHTLSCGQGPSCWRSRWAAWCTAIPRSSRPHVSSLRASARSCSPSCLCSTATASSSTCRTTRRAWRRGITCASRTRSCASGRSASSTPRRGKTTRSASRISYGRGSAMACRMRCAASCGRRSPRRAPSWASGRRGCTRASRCARMATRPTACRSTRTCRAR